LGMVKSCLEWDQVGGLERSRLERACSLYRSGAEHALSSFGRY
jgi:hypothetical protein